jgi:hypothetical protein
VPQAAEFHVNTYTSNFQLAPQVSLDGLGNFVVVWADVARAVIAGRRFGPTGSPVGGEFTIPAAGAAGAPSRPAVAADPPGFVVAWEDYGSVDDFGEVYARRYDGAGAAGPVFRLDQYSGGTQSEPAVATLPGRGLVATWWAWDQVGRPDGIFARRLGDLGPSALAADPAGSSTSNGNGVMEPGETLTVAPTWRNSTAAARPATGMLSQFTGPGAASLYTITDAAAGYGTLPATGTGGCTAAGNCYALALAVPGARPAAHWDATVREDVTATALQPPEVWRLHVGDSFTDVPRSSPFYRFVETLFHRGVAGGCAAGLYCPQTSATREQMAVFVLGGREPSWFGPLPCTPGQEQFADVPASSPFCSWIEELARRGVTSGCDGANYCPTAPVSREQMSVFVLRTLDPLLDPPACGTPVFSDVPASSPFCRWIEELARRGIVGGCAPGLYCPTASVSRQEMAVFITGTFGLTLYGP